MTQETVFIAVLLIALIFLILIILYLFMSVRKLREASGGYSAYDLESLNQSLEHLLIQADESTLKLSDEIKHQEFVLKQLLELVDKRKAELEKLIQQSDDTMQATRAPSADDSKEDIAFYLERGFEPQEIAKKLGKPMSEVSLMCRILASQNQQRES
ncbi:hypothetical protein [Desulfurispira natronophila]|uniref:Putative Holliday junction resolvase-like endonuclease n=1 Tax=Desulfurispira natronophila TaxID=682562 RepID=A0A7W7Y479_9BACT|nr:hypothetical protein [Desulfurispira natronophila]MBB5021739.1 putative Holliday junction resolvase-like endonuclease [Desulfurispira natronophila]